MILESKLTPQLPKVSFNKNDLVVTDDRQKKLDDLLDLIDGIEKIGDYNVIKFNESVLFASTSNIAFMTGEHLVFRTINGVINLN